MLNSTNFTTTTVSSIISSSSTDIFLSNFIDFCTTFIVPVICFFGMATNTINFIIFSRKDLNDIVFKYYKAYAVSNFLYLAICFFLFVARCGIYCKFSSTYAAQYYLYMLYTYIKGIFAIFCICINILITFYRFLLVSNKNTSFIKKQFWLIITVLLIFSAVFYSPILFTKEIKQTVTNVTKKVNGTVVGFTLSYSYSNVSNAIGLSDVGKWLIIAVVTIFRGFISLGIIFFIDILTLIRLKKHVASTNKLKSIKINLIL